MGGYNTFCEILSFGKPALLVPRTTPRLEQYLRAERAQRLGLVRMLPDDGARAPALMAAALRALPAMPVLAEEVRAPDAAGAGADHQAWPRPGWRPAATSCASCAAAGTPDRLARRVAVLVKGYPRLSETFIAQEILALERLGLELEIVSLRHPTDGRVHPLHEAIRAPVRYLPEYLYQEPLAGAARARAGVCRGARSGGCCGSGWATSPATSPPNRGRRLGPGLGAGGRAARRPSDWLHVHYLHTPASVARYAAILRGLPFSISAHAKDVWTIPDWEKREKIADARAGW